MHPDHNDNNPISTTLHTPKIDLPTVELVLPGGYLNYPPQPKPSSQHIPPYKQLAYDIIHLKQENINVSDLMKNIGISYSSLSGFLTFYQTLQQQLANYNVFITPANDIDSNNLSEPQFVYQRVVTDLQHYLSNTIYSFLSKDGVLKEEFKEGHGGLALTSSSYDGLKILLSRTHP